jgi:hypothetical protein
VCHVNEIAALSTTKKDTMTTTPVGPIAVVGATGQQGSATVNALLDRYFPR